jgi:hypothetical protein
MANSVEANRRRRRREPPVIDWDEALAHLHDILDDIHVMPAVGELVRCTDRETEKL